MSKKVLFPLFAALAAGLLAGCAAPPKLPRLFWPPPPETPRLEFVGVYASDDDFPKSGSQLFMEKTLGKQITAWFRTPMDVTVTGDGTIFVTDLHARNIRAIDFDARTANLLFKSQLLDRPAGIASDGAGRLYVADTEQNAVLVFESNGSPVLRIGDAKTLSRPAYLALNERLGRLYVSDGQADRIVVFDLQGRHLFSFGKSGRGPGELAGPQGVAIDAQDRVFVADKFNARIVYFDAEGNFLGEFGERGDTAGTFESPRDLAFDSEGHLYVSDDRRPGLIVYEPAGQVLLTLISPRATGHLMAFESLGGIWIDRNDRLYMVDRLKRRLTIWQYLSADYLRRHPVTEADRQALERWVEEERKKAAEQAPTKKR